jgi:hypothetical protein
MTTRYSPGGKPRGTPLGFFAAAAGYLGRPDPVCPVHGVRHTGKLARLIVLDLALLDATGDPRYWEEARLRAEEVAAQLAPDPEHGSLIYLPGRLDPRNCSNSAIDSGECTDALARLLSHPRAESLPEAERRPLEETVAGNAATYLAEKVTATAITNQRLWGAMGLATAARWRPVPDWTDAVRLALESALDEQRADGSWGYEPRASEHGGHPGAADLTVYYHGRCLAFLLHILDCLPALDGPRPESALRRGLEFLAAVTTPDGRKPLALEGKRWFWVSQGEAGSNAYDVYALLRGADRFGVDAWRRLAARSWASLVGRQAPDGSIVAGDSARTPDFVCPTFHTADTAWAAQVLDDLGALQDIALDEGAETPPGLRVRHFADAGVVRLENERTVALLRTAKQPRNTQWGGAAGGGTVVYVGDTATGVDRLRFEREAPEGVASFTLYPARPRDRRRLAPLVRLQRIRRSDRPGREGRQWLFVARLLLAQGRPGAAWQRLWGGYLSPLRRALADPAATHWATRAALEVLPDGRLRIAGQPARPAGDVPDWASGVTLSREVALEGAEVHLTDRLADEEAGATGAPTVALVVYLLPEQAKDVRIAASDGVRRGGRGGRRLEMRPAGRAFFLRVAYAV